MKIPMITTCVRHAVSTDPGRPTLNCILAEADGSYVATNGHMLLHVSLGGAAEQDPACVEGDRLEQERKVARTRRSDAVELAASEEVAAGDFPNWREVVPAPVGKLPEHKEPKTVTLDGRYLERLLKAARELHPGKSTAELPLKITVGKPCDPVLFEMDAEPVGTLRGVVMPIRP